MLKILNLKERPDCIPQLAEWFFEEWGYLHPEKTKHDIAMILSERIHKNGFDRTLVAFKDDELVGTISLKANDLVIRPQWRPWIAALYVKEEKRNFGIGKRLLSEIEEEAKTLGERELYLYTTRAQSYYEKLEWKKVEDTEYLGHYIAIFRKIF